jgi:hypothetical protein
LPEMARNSLKRSMTTLKHRPGVPMPLAVAIFIFQLAALSV